ncbi:related to kinesin motor [Lecanosticta acicola]|uniref:Kinesin-like protein KIP2 n=1 Tax=Lecanosticta acicola TaxID=111012 RepID=A0AAI8Z9L5_9PEZI|nr:related to kinesin motor [Lecanosticta acicola]
MTSALPRTPRPPPTGPLPALPVSKNRKPAAAADDDDATPDSRRTSTASQRPALAANKRTAIPSRSATVSALPTLKTSKAYSTPALPTLNTNYAPPPSPSPSIGTAVPKTVRKTTSIGSFPLPPKGASRVTSLPPSPLSASTSSKLPNGAQTLPQAPTRPQRDASRHRSADAGLKKPNSRSSGYGLRPRVSVPGTAASPSLLNGTGDNAMISSGGVRASDSMLSIPSPPQSRSSSAEGSYTTDATAIEDAPDELGQRGRSRTHDKTAGSKRESDAKDSKGNVLVSVRVRPDSGGDGNADGEWMVDGRRSLISYNGREGGDYRYDNVFSPNDQNARVYDNAAKRLVRRVMEGYHGTVFAYGMTGTGKTFSMQGTANSPGVIPLAITDIFSYIRENPEREFLLRVSYLEIYNEKIYDLLSQNAPGQQQEEIKLREDSKRGVYATPLKEEIVQSPNQLLRVIARGDLARRTGSTQFNARSSRSHAVVQIVVESRARSQNHAEHFKKDTRRSDKILPGGVLVSTLSLIDLAGSEKAAESKERRTEGAHINKSLLTLGTVIARLSGDDEKDEKEGARPAEKEKGSKHLPYRDSKLTRLLQPALSGNSLVSILCTIQLSSAGSSAALAGSHTGETLNTLKFASRAKNNIVSHAKRNESNPNPQDPNSRALLDRYRLEIQDLRAQLEAQNKAKEEAEQQEEIENDRKMEEELERQEQTRHEEQMLEMQLARTALKERISHLNRLILSSKSLGVNSGRFSSASMPFNPRLSMYSVSQSEYGQPVGVPSRESLHEPQRDSAVTLGIPVPNDRPFSSGSITMGTLPAAAVSRLQETPAVEEEDEDGEDSRGDDGEGQATLAQQNRMLQTDLADKNRYIATLEKRLLQARRTSHSRVSMGFASRVGVAEEGSLEAMLRDRDREIDDLRAKLDDQMRMVTALRSAARKREMIEKRKSHATTTSEDTARPATSSGVADTVPDLNTLPFRRHNSSRASRHSSRSNTAMSNGHRSIPSLISTTSKSSSGAVNFSKTPLSPVAILSPGHSSNNSRESIGKVERRVTRRKSVDEMTQLLDQMIQDKVESGHVVRGERGSLRVRHDTVLAQINDVQSGEEGEGETDGSSGNNDAMQVDDVEAGANATTAW